MSKKFEWLRRSLLPGKLRCTCKKLLFWLLKIRTSGNGGGLLQLGMSGAPWVVRADLLPSDPLLLSAGLSDDIAFEDNFLSHFGHSKLIGYDPTPISLGVMDEVSKRYPDRVQYRPHALGARNGTIDVLVERDSEGVPIYFYWSQPTNQTRGTLHKESIQVVGIQDAFEDIPGKIPDIVKLDIEGAEYEILAEIAKSKYRPKQIMIEFHYRFQGRSLRETIRILSDLRKQGYILEWMSPWREEFLLVHH